jgi:hypothetical protein
MDPSSKFLEEIEYLSCHSCDYHVSFLMTICNFFFCSGKGVYGMLKDMSSNPAKWKGRKVLFIHTGGLLGLYDKVDQLSSLAGSWRRMNLEESLPRKDGTGKMF